MSLQNLLDEFKGRSLLDTSVMTLPSPIMLELLEMKGKDRNEDEEIHYHRLVKNCPKFKIKGYCLDEASIMTSEQITYLIAKGSSSTLNKNNRQPIPQDYKHKRKTLDYDWEDLREKIRKEYEKKPFTVISTRMPTEREIQLHGSITSNVTPGMYPFFKTTATAEKQND